MGLPEVASSQFPSSCPLFVMDTACFLSERYYDSRNIATPLNEQSLLVDTNRNDVSQTNLWYLCGRILSYIASLNRHYI